MSKKKRWFNKGWGGSETEISPGLFPNSVAKHEKKLQTYDEDDSYSSYHWDLDKKLIDNNRNEDKETRYETTKSEYADSYKEYEKTGHWTGYYRQPQLTYKYVQQMASALSAQNNVKVQIGSQWKVDLLNKTLTYNPASLIYGTKAELLATLMHEIGKLRYVTHYSLLKNKYLTMYQKPANEVLSIYEDLRTDNLMLKAYESASEIYESVIPTIEVQVKNYMKFGEVFREIVKKVPEAVYGQIINNHLLKTSRKVADPNDPKLQADLLKVFGTPDIAQVEKGLKELQKALDKKGNIYEYCGEMLTIMYDLDDQGHRKYDNITEKVEKTVDTLDPSKKLTESQALVDYLDTTTFPVVEDLLKDAKDQQDAIEKAFPQMSAQSKKEMQAMIDQNMEGNKVAGKNGGGVNVDENGNTRTRSSGQTNIDVPPEWQTGDYRTLKDSVSMEIRQLIRKLTYLRREELTVRFQGDQKRGKLNSKKLYKSGTGSKRLFKKKMENTDTIRSFCFSILLDVSGSMDGSRIAHCTRALIILAEVFKKMEIPFEISVFDNGAKNIKPFGKGLDAPMEKQIGGLVKHSGGGTNLNRGLDLLKIHDQPERNKIVVVLTDGGVGDPERFDNDYFIPWKKEGIKSVGFGIECEEEMADLCEGNSKVLDNASELPVEFSNLLKNLIKRK